MTKKHFRAIAETIRVERNVSEDWEYGTLDHLAHELADTFARINSSFDRGRFLRACGVQAAAQRDVLAVYHEIYA